MKRRNLIMSGVWLAIALALGGVAGGDDGEARLGERLAPSERIAVEPLPSEKPVGSVPLPERVVLPKVLVAAGPRPMPAGLAAPEPAAPAERPAVLRAEAPAPGRPQFAEGPRQPATPSAVLAPRIPNLVQSHRRAMVGSSNPFGAPAAAVNSPAVNDASGTSVLGTLAPFKREIQVEVAPSVTVLPFDEAPYVQVAGAPDEVDAPGVVDVDPVRARIH
jgi:hypothetical protein